MLLAQEGFFGCGYGAVYTVNHPVYAVNHPV